MQYRYDPAQIEPKWQTAWEDQQVFRAVEDPTKPKFYGLVMFPYPSGAGLHVGHPESYTAVDIVCRQRRMKGYAVLNPIGFDAFGLPAERAAMRENRHPAEITRLWIQNFRHQLKRLGFSFDWSREISTCEPDYYRWTQWIFLKLHEQGLAYLAEVPVNWCPAQGTVLANEEVVDGKYVETGDPVERRVMKQWMLRITKYAERLLNDLDGLDWPEGVLEMQRQWIGRSEGAEVRFGVEGSDEGFTIYTTRPDTLFGVTYCVLAPEHPLVAQLTTADRREAVEAYVTAARNRSDMDRQLSAEREKTGVFTGSYAVNPVSGERAPIWVADYVLMTYGTGAIMAVPAHDERDHAFARKMGLPIVPVITPPEGHDIHAAAWTGDGLALNSGAYDGLAAAEFKAKILNDLEASGAGKRKVNYKLRDWLFSRQRYWGEPFPMAHLDDGEVVPVPLDVLPVTLPHVDEYKPTDDGQPPLARAEEAWLRTTVNGRPATRETNTMPQWAGSCWYYLRYMDAFNQDMPFSPEKERFWGPVDLYIGGVEHAVLHLLYARFWHKVLFDCGLVHTKEPFTRLFNQGMILAYAYREPSGKYHRPETVERRVGKGVKIISAWTKDEVETEWFVAETEIAVEQRIGKMGKSLNNSVDPLDIVAMYGADTLRIYEMFMGPLEQVKPWQTQGCEGVHRFLSRVWRLFVNEETGETRPFGETSPEVRRALHLAIKEASDGIEALRFNTPISKMMEVVNAAKGEVPAREDAEAFVKILSAWAPHLGEELWARFGNAELITFAPWPAWDRAALIADTANVAVQVQGKLRGQLEVPKDTDGPALIALARALPNVQKHLEGMEVVKEVVVPGRLVNFVVRPAKG
ncbi:MAG: leucine--tRNA ligase [Deltaproteobacteria bacterium]|nr:leucine--tRNA ligase [Deltaproteobacteria bacterium]